MNPPNTLRYLHTYEYRLMPPTCTGLVTHNDFLGGGGATKKRNYAHI